MDSVLIADDEQWIRKLIITLLPRDGERLLVVGEAEDGEQGLELARRTRPDIVISDIRMPVLSGLEFIERLKTILPHSEVIIISGYDNFEYARTAIKFGVRDFLLKPVEEADLRAALERAMANLSERAALATKKSTLERQVRRLAAERVSLGGPDYGDIANEKIRLALRHIHAHFAEPISLGSVSDQLVMNPSYFSELFKKETGHGFSTYLTELRLDTAKRLLCEESGLSVGDIAKVCGFQDPNYFSRLFHKRCGCTPLEYRAESARQRSLT